MIRPEAAERRARKHERYLREIRDHRGDAEIVEMIAETIEATMADAHYPVICFNHDVLGYSSTEETVAKELNRFASAVLDKLRAEGVVR